MAVGPAGSAGKRALRFDPARRGEIVAVNRMVERRGGGRSGRRWDPRSRRLELGTEQSVRTTDVSATCYRLRRRFRWQWRVRVGAVRTGTGAADWPVAAEA